MLQETHRRLQGLQCGPAMVVCNDEHRFMVAEQLREVGAKVPRLFWSPRAAIPPPPSPSPPCRCRLTILTRCYWSCRQITM